MKYLVIDAFLNGTGIREKYEGGYLDPKSLGLSSHTIKHLKEWLSKYANEHYNGYANTYNVTELDREGKEIASIIKNELSKVKVEYYSDALLISEMV